MWLWFSMKYIQIHWRLYTLFSFLSLLCNMLSKRKLNFFLIIQSIVFSWKKKTKKRHYLFCVPKEILILIHQLITNEFIESNNFFYIVIWPHIAFVDSMVLKKVYNLCNCTPDTHFFIYFYFYSFSTHVTFVYKLSN